MQVEEAQYLESNISLTELPAARLYNHHVCGSSSTSPTNSRTGLLESILAKPEDSSFQSNPLDAQIDSNYFPEGGFRAWLVVFGVCMFSFFWRSDHHSNQIPELFSIHVNIRICTILERMLF